MVINKCQAYFRIIDEIEIVIHICGNEVYNDVEEIYAAHGHI